MFTGIAIICRKGLKSEIGFQISNKYWGKGYGKETAKAIINIAQNFLYSVEVLAKVNSQNSASLHILASLGFQNIGFDEKDRIILKKYS